MRKDDRLLFISTFQQITRPGCKESSFPGNEKPNRIGYRKVHPGLLAHDPAGQALRFHFQAVGGSLVHSGFLHQQRPLVSWFGSFHVVLGERGLEGSHST